MRWLRILLRSLFATLVIVIFLGIRMCFFPSNWVEVTLRNVPDGIGQAYLIADRPDGVKAMYWYGSKIAPIIHDPRGGDDWHREARSSRWRADVVWLRGDRHGVLAQREDGAWRLWWLGPDDLDGPPAWRLIWGVTTAWINLPDESRASMPSKELLDRLGLPDLPVLPFGNPGPTDP